MTALKDSGGASDDYKGTIQHLSVLDSILSAFDKIKVLSNDPDIVSLVNASLLKP
jgi:hypothetical protein